MGKGGHRRIQFDSNNSELCHKAYIMYRLIIMYFIVLLFCSCSEEKIETIYAYKGVEILRLDRPGSTEFYYSKNGINHEGKISAIYSGINDGFAGYLVFHENGTVTLVKTDGYFQLDGSKDSLFKLMNYPLRSGIKSGENVYEILLSRRYEKMRNKDSYTNVSVKY